MNLKLSLGASQILQSAIVEAKLAAAGPRIHVVRPAVGGFAALDFFAARRILQAAEPIRAEVSALLRGAA